MARDIRILVIGKPSLMRDGLQALLSVQAEMEPLGVIGNDTASIDSAVMNTIPDVAIVHLPTISRGGLDGLAAVRNRWPTVPVIILSPHLDERGLNATREIGIAGYLLETDNHAELLLAIRTVMEGKHYLTPSVSGMGSSPPDGLTERERVVLRLIATGYRTREIADQLSLSGKTVEKYRASLMRKLGLRSAAAVAAYAISHGYLIQ